jgi:hypothetical protein
MGRRTGSVGHRPPKGLTASRMSGSGPKILILGEPTRFPAFARLGVGLWLRVERQRIPITRKSA